MHNLSLKWFFLAVLLSANLSLLKAEQKLTVNGTEVHYNAFNAAMLSAEVASTYGIIRSKSLGVLNLAILEPSGKANTAFIKGEVKNDLSQSQNLSFRKIQEGDAIYYIATFNFTQANYMKFDIDLVPTGQTQPIKVKFTQQFFTGQ